MATPLNQHLTEQHVSKRISSFPVVLLILTTFCSSPLKHKTFGITFRFTVEI